MGGTASSISGTATGAGNALGGGFEGGLGGGFGGGVAGLASAEKYSYLSKSKDKVVVLPFLADGGDLGGDFYGIRRGWGLDLTGDQQPDTDNLEFEITLSYEDRDIRHVTCRSLPKAQSQCSALTRTATMYSCPPRWIRYPTLQPQLPISRFTPTLLSVWFWILSLR